MTNKYQNLYFSDVFLQRLALLKTLFKLLVKIKAVVRHVILLANIHEVTLSKILLRS